MTDPWILTPHSNTLMFIWEALIIIKIIYNHATFREYTRDDYIVD